MFKQLYLPLAIILSVATSVPFVPNASSSVWLAAFGSIVLLINVVFLPLFVGLYVSKPNVDMAYYFLGLVGVVLFFEAERFERELSELRQQNFDLSQEVADTTRRVSQSEGNIDNALNNQTQNLDRLLEASEITNNIYFEILDEGSERGSRLLSQSMDSARLRLLALDSEGLEFERRLLGDILEMTDLRQLIRFHGFGPRHANMVRSILDPREEIVTYLVRECLLTQSQDCRLPDEAFAKDRELILNLQEQSALYADPSSSVYSDLRRAEEASDAAQEELNSALQQRAQGTSISDGVFIYADRFRRSFWPYAIIIAFSLKLASANSARSNEAIQNKEEALQAYQLAAMTAQSNVKKGARTLRKAFKLSRKRSKKITTLGEAEEYTGVVLGLINAAEANGQIDLAYRELKQFSTFVMSFDLYEKSTSGLSARAKALQLAGDNLVQLNKYQEARTLFLQSHEDFSEAQQRSFSDESYFDLAKSVVRLAVVQARLRDNSSENSWLQKLAPLRREMSNQQNEEVDAMIGRARQALKNFPK